VGKRDSTERSPAVLTRVSLCCFVRNSWVFVSVSSCLVSLASSPTAVTDEISVRRGEHGFRDDVKWTKVSKFGYDCYAELVDVFFATSWLWFHCLLVEKSVVRKELHGGDYDLARRKHLTMLLTDKVKRALRT
jgi:hypothetical protein